MTKVTAGQAAQAIEDKKGFITHAAKQLGISRRQLHNLVNLHPTVKEALTDAREEMKDFTESKMYQAIADGNTTMIIFYAKTQMKDRGYVERQEIVGKDSGPVEVAISPLDKINRALDSIAANTAASDDPERID
ncbi:hypothetical protein LCGC14_2874260 [marine sediment metagenome]|uniref:DNA binding HTH domain-containing protein n=1 Tax=marine sediment metagenome TaxID=412755 RepID=A0A0F8Y202_9ZZZZ